MPQEQKKQQESRRVNPSKGFLERLLGSSEPTPIINEGINIARQENPNLGNVEMYGPISRMLMGNANAYVSPGKTIYLNPNNLSQPQEVADTLAHEQKHVEQIGNNGIVGEILKNSIFGRGFNKAEPYHRDPREMEAFKAEEDRRRKMGRAGTTAIPSFSTGEFYTPRDIKLRAPDDPVAIAERQRKLLGGR